jgi:cytochrome c oxidase cbb3-type subunit 1
MSIRAVNALSHYTDWTIGHVHSGALGWVGMISFACMYFLAPRVFGAQRIYSLRLINWHFWLAMGGITLYTASMWVAGIMQGLMWREFNAEGYLVYSFAEVTAAMHPYYLIRLLGGLLYFSGALVMAFNIWMTHAHKLRAEAPLDGGTPYNPTADRPLAPASQPVPQPAE